MCIKDGFQLTLAAAKHLAMNSIVERTWQSLVLLRNAFLVHARMDDSATHFALKYACEVFSVTPVYEKMEDL